MDKLKFPKNKKRAKDRAWAAFSRYIRMKYANKSGMVECITCHTFKHWKEMQAGHFVDGRNNTVLFDERLVHPQCLTKESKIKKYTGKSVSIKKIKTGDILLGFDDKTLRKKKSFVESVAPFLPNELFKVELSNGKHFK